MRVYSAQVNSTRVRTVPVPGNNLWFSRVVPPGSEEVRPLPDPSKDTFTRGSQSVLTGGIKFTSLITQFFFALENYNLTTTQQQLCTYTPNNLK